MGASERDHHRELEIKQNIVALGPDQLLEDAHRPEVTFWQRRYHLVESRILAVWAVEASEKNPIRAQHFAEIAADLRDEIFDQEINELVVTGARMSLTAKNAVSPQANIEASVIKQLN